MFDKIFITLFLLISLFIIVISLFHLVKLYILAKIICVIMVGLFLYGVIYE